MSSGSEYEEFYLAMSSGSEYEEFYKAVERFETPAKSRTDTSILFNWEEHINKARIKAEENEKRRQRVEEIKRRLLVKDEDVLDLSTEESTTTSINSNSTVSFINGFNSSSNKQDLSSVLSFDNFSDLASDEKNNLSIHSSKDKPDSSKLYSKHNSQEMVPEHDLMARTSNQHEEAKPVPPPRKTRRNKPRDGKIAFGKTISASTLSEVEQPSLSITDKNTAQEFAFFLESNNASFQFHGGNCIVKSQDVEEDHAENTDSSSDTSFMKEDLYDESDDSLKQLITVMSARTQSGRSLVDQDTHDQNTVLNLETGERIPLSLVEDCLPNCVDPLSLHIMRLTAEYSINTNAIKNNESGNDIDLKINAESNTDKKALKEKKILDKTIKNPIKIVADEVPYSQFTEEVDSSEEETTPGDGTSIKFRVSDNNKGPYKFQDLRVLQELNGENTGAVWNMKFSPCGRLLATAGQDAVLKIWVLRNFYSYFDDIRKQYTSNVLLNPLQEILSFHHADDQSKAETTDSTEDTSGPFMTKPFSTFEGHTSYLLDISWSQNYFILSSSMDNTVRLWHIGMQTCLCCFQHPEIVTSVVFHPRNNSLFLSGSLDGKLRLWNIVTKRVEMWKELNGGFKLITAIGFSKRGRYAIVGTYDGRCIFYELKLKKLKYRKQIRVHSTRWRNAKGRKVTAIVSIPRKNKILVTTNDSRIRLYNMKMLRKFSLSCKYKGHINFSSQVRASFSHDGKYIISGSESNYMYIWKTRHGYTTARGDRNDYWEGIKAHNSAVTVAVFAPDANLIFYDPDQVQHRKMSKTKGYVIVSAGFGGIIKVLTNKTAL